MIVLVIIMLFMAVLTYLIIVGGNMNKTQKEIEDEEKAQIEYIETHKNGWVKIGRNKRSKNSL